MLNLIKKHGPRVVRCTIGAAFGAGLLSAGHHEKAGEFSLWFAAFLFVSFFTMIFLWEVGTEHGGLCSCDDCRRH